MRLTTPIRTMAQPATQKEILICMPAYNEEGNIGAVLDNILALKDGFDLFDVLVIDDGSTDKTRAICKEKGIMVISHIYNMGYGASLKTAYKYATECGYDYIIQIDADGQHDVSNIERIYRKLTEGGDSAPDIVIGSRFLKDSVSFHIPFKKKIAISTFKFFIKAVTKNIITDPTSGLQGLNHDAFTFYAQFGKFAMDFPDANMIIQMALNDFTICEVPAVMYPRYKGRSMHSGIYKPMKYVIKMILSVFIVCIREIFNKRRSKRGRSSKNALT